MSNCTILLQAIKFHLTFYQTLFLLIDSDAPSKDCMQADNASCDNPWNTALWWKKRETSACSLHKTKRKMRSHEGRKQCLLHFITGLINTWTIPPQIFSRPFNLCRLSHGSVTYVHSCPKSFTCPLLNTYQHLLITTMWGYWKVQRSIRQVGLATMSTQVQSDVVG